MKWLITCHVWRKPINHPGKISVWNHHLEKLNIFVEHRNMCVPKSRHLRFGGYPLPLKFDEWIPMQNWCLWKKYLRLHINFFDYVFRYLWATVNGSGEHLNSPPPECFKGNFIFQPSIFGDMFLAISFLHNWKHVFFHNPTTAPHGFCPHRTPYHMDAGQYFASIEFISTSKSHTIHVWYIYLHVP